MKANLEAEDEEKMKNEKKVKQEKREFILCGYANKLR